MSYFRCPHCGRGERRIAQLEQLTQDFIELIDQALQAPTPEDTTAMLSETLVKIKEVMPGCQTNP